MLQHWIPVGLMMGLGIGFPIVTLLLGKMVRPSNPNPIKSATYECGEIPKSGAWIQFNIRFYVIGLTFLIFDVEAALMYPVATVFRQAIENGDGLLALGKILFFVITLVVGLAYGWKKGDLEWVRSIKL